MASDATDGKQKWGSLKEVTKKIRQLDEWFKFAEQIGQQRLYNFLMAASILFLASATTINSGLMGATFAIAVAGLGVVFSFLWLVLGTRQGKFHNMLGKELSGCFGILDDLKNNNSKADKAAFAIFHIQNMKGPDEAAKTEEVENPKKTEKSVRLNTLENFCSNRRFFWGIPALFGIAFIVVIVIGCLAYQKALRAPLPNPVVQPSGDPAAR